MTHTRSDDLLVAISYAAADEPVARAAMARLEARGLTAALTVESPVDAALMLVVLSSASDAESGQLAHLHAAHAARCPICGAEIRLDPSRPPADAPCPQCGTLLWFNEAASDWRTLTRFCPELAEPPSPVSVALQTFETKSLRVGCSVRIRQGLSAGIIGAVSKLNRLTGRIVVLLCDGGTYRYVEMSSHDVDVVA